MYTDETYTSYISARWSIHVTLALLENKKFKINENIQVLTIQQDDGSMQTQNFSHPYPGLLWSSVLS
jgi:hypothetical protein